MLHAYTRLHTGNPGGRWAVPALLWCLIGYKTMLGTFSAKLCPPVCCGTMLRTFSAKLCPQALLGYLTGPETRLRTPARSCVLKRLLLVHAHIRCFLLMLDTVFGNVA